MEDHHVKGFLDFVAHRIRETCCRRIQVRNIETSLQ